MVNNADMVGMVSRDGDGEVMIGGRECGEQAVAESVESRRREAGCTKMTTS